MKRDGYKITRKQHGRMRLVRTLLRDWGSHLRIMTPACTVRLVESAWKGGRV